MSDETGGPAGRTAYARLADEIRQQIISGRLSPGDQLPAESELTAHYQVSRNTAREALRSLASQGLLVIKRGVAGGTFVARPSPAHLSDSLQTGLALLADGADLSVAALVEVRELLEVPAAELAAYRRTSEDLTAAGASLFDPRGADPDSVFVKTSGFHLALLHAAHNPLLELIAEPVFRVIEDRFPRGSAPAGFWHDVDADHREIFDHVASGDQAGAREAARAHLRRLSATYEHIDRTRGASRQTSEN